MRLRAAIRADIPALVELTLRCDRSHEAWTGRRLPIPSVEEESLSWEVRFSRAGAWIRIAESDDGSPLGVVALARARLDTGDRALIPGCAHVSAVFVEPEHWRQGIGRALLEAAEEAMRDAGFTRAQLWTLEGSPAERLYAALGWRRDGRRGRHSKMALDTVSYVKDLN